MRDAPAPALDPAVPPAATALDDDVVARGGRARRSQRRVLLWLFVLMSASFLILQQGAVTGYDGGTMFEVTKSMVDRGSFVIPDEWNTLPGRGGLPYSRYGPGLSLVAAIPYALARPLANLSGHADEASSAAVASAMPLISAALVAALYLLARRMGARIGPALLAGVGAVIGTFMLPYTKEFFSEPLATLCLVVAIERLLADRPLTAGLAIGAAVLTRPQAVLFAPVLVLVGWRRQGMTGSLRAILGLTPGLLATFAYNAVRFGNPLSFGYQDVGFTTPFLRGAGGLLFDPLKSVFLFAPVVVLLPFALAHLWRVNRSAFVLITANLAITFVVSATWFAWHGGWSWGPRLLLPGLLPAVAAIAPWMSTATRQRVAALFLAAGFVVSAPALIVSTQAQQLEVTSPPRWTHYLDTQPVSSPSVQRQFELIEPTARYSVEHLYEGRAGGRNDLRSLSLWQLGAMRVLGPPGLVVAATGTVFLIAVCLASFSRLRTATSEVARLDREQAESGIHEDAHSRARGVGDDLRGAERAETTRGDERQPPSSGAYAGTPNLEAMEAARKYHEFLVRSILASADVTRPIIDFGAGTGTHARRLRDLGVQVSCVEPDPHLRRQLQDQGFQASSGLRDHRPRRSASIYSLNVLEHIEDDAAALRDLFAATEPGGQLILYVPAFQVLFSAMDRRVGHFRRYRRAELIGLVRQAGFRVATCVYVDSLGFVAALAYRFLPGTGELNPRLVGIYDRYVFPLSRMVDRATCRWFGKNLLLVASRD